MRLALALRELGEGAGAWDIKALVGRQPWLRLRVGDYRVLMRALDPAKDGEDGYLVARIVHRRDLERSVGTL
jgi:hypothetical protein